MDTELAMALSKYAQLKPTLLRDTRPAIYKLPLNTVHKDLDHRIAKCELGTLDPDAPPPGKVFMLLGQTGSGKTTLINVMINHILGVEWKDPYRFQLISSEDGAPSSQSKSQTKWITIYVIHKMPSSVLPFTLTIIDTPGYGDCEGLKRDKEITAQISALVQNPSLYGLTELHGIGFVVQASAMRLTPTQKYIYESILAILGKDVGNNILIMITFSDAGDASIMEAINEAKVPYRKDGSFKFNSSAIFAPLSNDEDETSMMKSSFSMTNKQVRKFFDYFKTIGSQNFQQTSDVLKERLLMEETVQSLAPEIQKMLILMDNLERERKIIKKNEACIDAHQPFEDELLERDTRKVYLKPGEHVTNCLVCSMTCHYPCYIPNDERKYRCDAMKEPKDKKTTCTKCPRQCSWINHVNQQFRHEIMESSVPRTLDDVTKFCSTGAITTEKAVAEIEAKIQKQNDRVLTMMGQVQRSIKRLEEIALKSNPLNEVEYIELLIATEIKSHQPGYENRVKYYEEAKKDAKLLSCIKDESTQQLRMEWYKEIRSKVFS